MDGSQTTPDAFVARRHFGGGHIQTLASFFIPRKVILPPSEERLIEVEPGVKVLCFCHWQPNRSQALTVIVVHGLEGSSDSQYMRGIVAKGFAVGMNVIRMNQRNCGGTEAIAPTLYHSGRSQDIAAVAQTLITQDGITRLALVGYSMGGNLVLKLAGEWEAPARPSLKQLPQSALRSIWPLPQTLFTSQRTGSTSITSFSN